MKGCYTMPPGCQGADCPCLTSTKEIRPAETLRKRGRPSKHRNAEIDPSHHHGRSRFAQLNSKSKQSNQPKQGRESKQAGRQSLSKKAQEMKESKIQDITEAKTRHWMGKFLMRGMVMRVTSVGVRRRMMAGGIKK